MEQSEKNLSELVDIRDVVIDKSLPLEERVRSYVEQIKDPYCFKVGDVVVRVSYADKDKSLTDSFTSMIASMNGNNYHAEFKCNGWIFSVVCAIIKYGQNQR